MAPKVETVSLTEIAAVFDVDPDTIGNWRDAGMPNRVTNGRPRFKLTECVLWRREQDKRDQKRKDTDSEGIDASLKRKAAADADLAEIKRDQMRGELVAVAEVRREMETLCRLVRARVLGCAVGGRRG
jgi:phage terminase Nu1 subunit (DNA packaging protein)